MVLVELFAAKYFIALSLRVCLIPKAPIEYGYFSFAYWVAGSTGLTNVWAYALARLHTV
jgi:hypothetical protein